MRNKMPILACLLMLVMMLFAPSAQAQSDSVQHVQMQVLPGSTVSEIMLKVTLSGNSWRSPEVHVMRPFKDGTQKELAKSAYDTVWVGDVVMIPRGLVATNPIDVNGGNLQQVCREYIKTEDKNCAVRLAKINSIGSTERVLEKTTIFIPNSGYSLAMQSAPTAPPPEPTSALTPSEPVLTEKAREVVTPPLEDEAGSGALLLILGSVVAAGGGTVIFRLRKKGLPLLRSRQGASSVEPARVRRRVPRGTAKRNLQSDLLADQYLLRMQESGAITVDRSPMAVVSDADGSAVLKLVREEPAADATSPERLAVG